jgi:hypothetical protein
MDVACRCATTVHADPGGDGFVELLVEEGQSIAFEDPHFRGLHGLPLAMPTDGPVVCSRPVEWWQLINEAERFRALTGWGLASVWDHIHSGEYDCARERMDHLIDTHWLTKHRTVTRRRKAS